MRRIAVRLILSLGALVPFVLLSSAGRAEEKKPEEGFTSLFNGKDLTGWKTYLKDEKAEPAKTWTIKDGVIHCTGQPFGYFYTEKSYKNYVIRYDWRYPKEQPEKTTLNSGLLFHIQEPHKVWPKCLEAQGAWANHGKIYFVSGAKKIGDDKFDMEAFKKALGGKAKEDWHTTEVTANADGSVVVKIDGVEVSSGKSDLTEGRIGFQSEGAAIEFKNIRIKEMK
jgi:hypothetical protein